MSNQSVALITGSNGFVGQWLADLLQFNGYKVFGIDNADFSRNQKIDYEKIDILEVTKMAGIIEKTQPELIFHLAGVSYLPDADRSPSKSIQINVLGTLTLFESVRVNCPSSKILFVGSSKEYSSNVNATVITEDIHPSPENFYGISKYCGEMFGQQYVRQFGMKIYFTRPFNHTGPGQSPLFVCSDWAKQIVAIERGLASPVLLTGNLESTIDFTDVRDVVDAYYKILMHGKAGEVYNICSGIGYTLEWILTYLTKKSSKTITIQQESAKQRNHATNRYLTGANLKLKKHTGWNYTIPMEKTLDDLYDYWLKQ
jgi:GDP-4-dehydro-6-deoxy-D-mannose reductase